MRPCSPGHTRHVIDRQPLFVGEFGQTVFAEGGAACPLDKRLSQTDAVRSSRPWPPSGHGVCSDDPADTHGALPGNTPP